MKAKILAGAVAALMYGTAAMAAEGDCPPSQASKDTPVQGTMMAQAPQGEMPMDDVQQEEDVIIETEPVPGSTGAAQDPLLEEGVGGSGDVGQDPSMGVQEPGIGGSGQQGQGEVLLRCEPVNQGTGGSGIMPAPAPAPAPAPDLSQEPQSQALPQDDATGGSGIATPPPSDFRPTAEAAEPIEPLEIEEKDKNDTRGLTLLVGGGVEGYTGELAPRINPGATAGVRASLKPSTVLGLELGYSGALNNIDLPVAGGAVDGPDLIRNGGSAVVTLGLFSTPWHPYVLGGIGINDYNFRGGESLGYTDDTVGSVPAGVGFRGHVGNFTVDARANYNFLFDKEFATGIEEGGGDFNEGGSYQGTLSVGGTF
ncbi:hypothetical protein HPC49_24530 [Pyxidicoccus fallax]|uniref:Outer membrane protein beta-barrel domain-containing protein n=1 Tax=Pyxidicoccus fallax TaxID=394095 RepID=A0A848LJG1_9BACT|nr:hypothetical protein [Pyxidicoccus fallax]NMO17852.1 hypothetical protein [Pyxidicoccus fallax]NPC81384.1 hypothetical protein [Pyxidicoccus fallax]